MEASAGARPQVPHNLEAEQAVLGALFMSNDAAGRVANILKAEDFFSAAHRLIYQACLALEGQVPQLDPILVAETLRREGKLEAIGGEDALHRLLLQAPAASLVEEFARLVRDKALLRRLAEAGREITALAQGGADEVGPILDEAGRLILDLGGEIHSGQPDNIQKIIHEVYEKLGRLDRHGLGGGIPTGYEDLDQLTTGLHRGELVVIAGRPSMGKTSLANNIIIRLSVRESIPTAIFSLEVSKEQVVQNLLSIHARFDAQRLRRGGIKDTEYAQLQQATEDLYKAPIFIDDSQDLTALGLRHKARRLKKTENIQLVVVDYLQLMASDQGFRAENRQQEISRISRSLKGLARELGIPVLALSQLNRSVEQRDDHRPRMSDLRESGAIEQDADVVMLLHREEYYRPTEENRGLAEIIVAKQRNGPTDTVMVHFTRTCMRFDSLVRRHDPDGRA